MKFYNILCVCLLLSCQGALCLKKGTDNNKKKALIIQSKIKKHFILRRKKGVRTESKSQNNVPKKGACVKVSKVQKNTSVLNCACNDERYNAFYKKLSKHFVKRVSKKKHSVCQNKDIGLKISKNDKYFKYKKKVNRYFRVRQNNKNREVFNSATWNVVGPAPKISCRKKCRKISKKTAQIMKKHEELKKRSHGDLYFIQNMHGCFSVCVQNHLDYCEVGIASYYDSGHVTSTGESFNTNYYTAAHPYLPLPCVAEVTSVDNPKRKILVKINDRGPFVKNKRVILDLTKRGFGCLGGLKKGLVRVRIKVLKKESMMLRENGGFLDWSGRCSFYEALRLRNKKKFCVN